MRLSFFLNCVLMRGLTNVVFHFLAKFPLCSKILTILVRADLICGNASLTICIGMVSSSHCFVFIFITILATSSFNTTLNSVSVGSAGAFRTSWYFSSSSSSLQIFMIFVQEEFCKFVGQCFLICMIW